MSSIETKKLAGIGGVTAAMGILAEMAEGAVVSTTVDHSTEAGFQLSLEFNPMLGNAATISTTLYDFQLPAYSNPTALYFECGSTLKLLTPSNGDITDVDGLVSSGTSLSLMSDGQTVSAANAFNNTFESSSYINFSFPTDQDLYLGYRFQQDGETGFNYGYCVLSVGESGFQNTLTLKSIAYETEIGTGITVGTVPEPATAGLLLFATLGVWLSRRLLRWNRPGE